jgi:hypothetical protein
MVTDKWWPWKNVISGDVWKGLIHKFSQSSYKKNKRTRERMGEWK